MLEHIENIAPIFNQSCKKLKKGGLLFISELHPFKQYLGSKARFETKAGMKELVSYPHHLSTYLDIAFANGFELVELKEWFDEGNENKTPRLIGILFRKIDF